MPTPLETPQDPMGLGSAPKAPHSFFESRCNYCSKALMAHPF